MHIRMHVRTFKLAKFFRGLYPWVPIKQGTEWKWGEREGVKGRRGEGKEKVEGITEGEEGVGNWDGGICATAARG